MIRCSKLLMQIVCSCCVTELVAICHIGAGSSVYCSPSSGLILVLKSPTRRLHGLLLM